MITAMHWHVRKSVNENFYKEVPESEPYPLVVKEKTSDDNKGPGVFVSHIKSEYDLIESQLRTMFNSAWEVS